MGWGEPLDWYVKTIKTDVHCSDVMCATRWIVNNQFIVCYYSLEHQMNILWATK